MFHNRGFAKMQLGQNEDAIVDYTKSIQLNPKDANTFANRGSAKIKLDRLEGAIADYDAAIKLNANEAIFLLIAG